MMEPFYEHSQLKIFQKDCRDMSELADNSVQCVVTSPPYWGLRKYSGEQDLIWGPTDCNHQWQSDTTKHDNLRFRGEHSIVGNERNRDIHPVDSWRGCEHQWVSVKPPRMATPGDLPSAKSIIAIHRTNNENRPGTISNTCSLCGAWKGAYGLEPTPEMYIEHTIEILREIRRVLRKDGVVFWNIGDSYAGSGSPSGDFRDGKGGDEYLRPYNRKGYGLKPKDLCLIPFRLAIAAQEDGWWVRSVIIWSKPNPMPESVTDRPTESHEYILMLTKSGTSQYWTHRDHEGSRTQPKPDYRWQRHSKPDVKAIQKEIGGMARRTVWEERDGEDRGWRNAADRQHSDIIEERDSPPEGWMPKNKMGWDRVNLWQGHDYYWDADAVRVPLAEGSWERAQRSELDAHSESRIRNKGTGVHGRADLAGRNIRSVWEFPTQPYPEAHFAVFPEKLPEICIKAATPEVGCCSKCGAPWERITKVSRSNESYWGKQGKTPEDVKSSGKYGDASASDGDRKRAGFDIRLGPTVSVKTLGWQPTCKCKATRVPSIVLDPFAGAGTTLWVAKKLNRQAIGYDISEEYCQLAVKRNQQMGIGV